MKCRRADKKRPKRINSRLSRRGDSRSDAISAAERDPARKSEAAPMRLRCRVSRKSDLSRRVTARVCINVESHLDFHFTVGAKRTANIHQILNVRVLYLISWLEKSKRSLERQNRFSHSLTGARLSSSSIERRRFGLDERNVFPSGTESPVRETQWTRRERKRDRRASVARQTDTGKRSGGGTSRGVRE